MEELRKEDFEIQSTFNKDGFEELVEDGEIENVQD